MRTGIAIFAHGSSIESANEAVRAVAERFAAQTGHELVEAAFLEGGEPGLPAAVAALVERGARRVLVVPYFLTLGLHLQRDLPRIIAGLQSIHNDVEIRVAPPLDGHPALNDALADRTRQALEQWQSLPTRPN